MCRNEINVQHFSWKLSDFRTNLTNEYLKTYLDRSKAGPVLRIIWEKVRQQNNTNVFRTNCKYLETNGILIWNLESDI